MTDQVSEEARLLSEFSATAAMFMPQVPYEVVARTNQETGAREICWETPYGTLTATLSKE